MFHNRARDYDPAIGRWTSEDPIGFAAGDANLFRYVGNEATNATDPSGKLPPGDAPWPINNSERDIRSGGSYFNPIKGVIAFFLAPDYVFEKTSWVGGISTLGKTPAPPGLSNTPPPPLGKNPDPARLYNDGPISGVALSFEPLIPGPGAVRVAKGISSKIPGRVKAAEAKPGNVAPATPKSPLALPPAKPYPAPFDKAWSAMSEGERRAFQHAYSRHANELGLPKWAESNADALRKQYNQAVLNIRTNATNVRFDRWPVGTKGSGEAGVWQEVRICEYTDPSGKKFYYAETLDGKFVSSGLSTK